MLGVQAEVALENVPEGTCYVMDSSEHKYLSRPGETEIAIGLQMAQVNKSVLDVYYTLRI